MTFEELVLKIEGFESDLDWMDANGDFFPEYLEDIKKKVLEDEDYFLTKIMEEASEIVQAASKVKLFGPDHSYDGGPTNLQKLIEEINDLQVVLALYPRTRSLPYNAVRPQEKVEKLLFYNLFSRALRVKKLGLDSAAIYEHG